MTLSFQVETNYGDSFVPSYRSRRSSKFATAGSGHSTDKQLKVSNLTGSNDYRGVTAVSVFIIGDSLLTNKIRTIKLAEAIILSSSTNDFLSFRPVFRGLISQQVPLTSNKLLSHEDHHLYELIITNKRNTRFKYCRKNVMHEKCLLWLSS